MQRKPLTLLYTAVAEQFADVVTDGTGRNPAVIAEYQRAGINLASSALTLLRMPEVVERARQVPRWSLRRTATGLELWETDGIWARAALSLDLDWVSAAHERGLVRVIYGVRTGVRLPEGKQPDDYTNTERASELHTSRRNGIVAIATIRWHG